MPEARIKVILFDLGNVLVDFDLRPAAERISSFCSKGPDEILKLLFDSGVTNSFEKGKISAEEFYKKAKDILDLKLGYESFVPIWNEVFFFSPKNRAVYHIANCLKKNYRIALLSNTNILHYRYIKDNFPLLMFSKDYFYLLKLALLNPIR